MSFAGPRRITPPGLALRDTAADPRGTDLARPLRPPGRRRRCGGWPPSQAGFYVPLGLGACCPPGAHRRRRLDWWDSRTERGLTRRACASSTGLHGRSRDERTTCGAAGWSRGGSAACSSRGTRLLAAVLPGDWRPLGPFDVARSHRRIHAGGDHAATPRRPGVPADLRRRPARRFLAMHWGTSTWPTSRSRTARASAGRARVSASTPSACGSCSRPRPAAGSGAAPGAHAS